MDESLLEDWENDDFPMPDEDQIDYMIASSLQSQYDAQTSKNFKDDSFLKSLDEDLDFAFALSLQEEFHEKTKQVSDITQKSTVGSISKSAEPLSIVDNQWELIDPHPDIHALFLEYDAKFFYGKLQGVVVTWSPRMTLCAGVCCYEGRGGLCSIRLSVPLLKLRPRRDLVETLLHEMIHAFLFVTHNNKDREGHGPEFLSHMNRINRETGTRISVYHSFHDEVDLYRQHWWKCNGPCKNRRPFYGLVKRAMNRAPGPKDNWWAAHQASCSGAFVKIKEPENYKKKPLKRKPDDQIKGASNIKNFFNDSPKSSVTSNLSTSLMTKSTNISTLSSLLKKESNVVPVKSNKKSPKKNLVPFQGAGQKLGGSLKNPLWSNSTHNQKNTSLNSIINNTPIIKIPKEHNFKIPKESDFKVSKSAKVSTFEVSKSKASSEKNDTKSKDLVQSPIEKFLSPRKHNLQVVPNKTAAATKVSVINLESDDSETSSVVNCPLCGKLLKSYKINEHLDLCLQNS